MSTRPTETVRIPSDTRGDDWGYRRSQAMHDRNANAIDRKAERTSKRREERRAKRK
jgi:hypothetical protein